MRSEAGFYFLSCVSVAFDGGMHFDFPMKVPEYASAIDACARTRQPATWTCA
ncbi:hypothetical protein BRPE64_ACDS16360 [Caballeronia insecticola]|uniref:Uncharacterized protein n=1 Tax=Caballeronia insecticola TaxID=758793 RepID=R4WR40_9BURK|nr:hypothetical protein BRPE64_ACDS16360 [Caballeronia insecticola]